MECYFCVDIHAPAGLRGIEGPIRRCELPLYAWTSGYNGKVVLRASSDDGFEWNMDSSDDDVMFASGVLGLNAEDAEKKLRSLSECLARAGFPHCILLDDPDCDLHARIEFRWTSELAP